jgi:hypothetical protein
MHSHQRRINIAVLRITHARIDTEERWTLCGQLTGPWVEELRASWEHSRQAAGNVPAVVDLSDVTFIDESGERLLAEMRIEGTAFVAAGVDTKHLLKHLSAPGKRSLRRFIAPLVSPCHKSGTTKNQG